MKDDQKLRLQVRQLAYVNRRDEGSICEQGFVPTAYLGGSTATLVQGILIQAEVWSVERTDQEKVQWSQICKAVRWSRAQPRLHPSLSLGQDKAKPLGSDLGLRRDNFFFGKLLALRGLLSNSGGPKMYFSLTSALLSKRLFWILCFRRNGNRE